jgi:hypothetical protein
MKCVNTPWVVSLIFLASWKDLYVQIQVSGVGVMVRQLIYLSTMTVRKAEVVVWCGGGVMRSEDE